MVYHDGLIDGKQGCGEEAGESCNTTWNINTKYVTIEMNSRLHTINCFKQYQQPKKMKMRMKWMQGTHTD